MRLGFGRKKDGWTGVEDNKALVAALRAEGLPKYFQFFFNRELTEEINLEEYREKIDVKKAKEYKAFFKTNALPGIDHFWVVKETDLKKLDKKPMSKQELFDTGIKYIPGHRIGKAYHLF